MDAQMQQPGMIQAIVNALRGATGMGAQQTLSPAMNAQTAYREYATQEMEQGRQPMPLAQWYSQRGAAQQPGAILR